MIGRDWPGLIDLADETDEICPHGYKGFCPLCTPVDKTAETTGLPLAHPAKTRRTEGSLTVGLAVTGLAVAVASFGAVILWLL